MKSWKRRGDGGAGRPSGLRGLFAGAEEGEEQIAAFLARIRELRAGLPITPMNCSA
jgi:hypothetical protein